MGREQVAERAELGEVPQQRPLVPPPQRELAAVVLEHAAEAVPLRLVLPVAVRELADELGLHRRERHVLAGHVRRLTACDLRLTDDAQSGRGHGARGVTPLGQRPPRRRGSRPWPAESGVDFISTFDTAAFPVRIAAEVRGLRPRRRCVGPKEARRLDRNVVMAVARRDRRRGEDAALKGVRAGPGRRAVRARRSAACPGSSSSTASCWSAAPTASRRTSSRACSSTRRAGRSRSRSGCAARTTRPCRPARPARTRSAREPSSSAAARRRGARRRHRGLHPPADPRRLLRDARPRRRGRGSGARLAAVRRDARGLRHGRGGVRPRARGARGARARGATIYAEVLGYGASNDAHHMAQPDPESVGVVEMMRAALERGGGRAGAGRLHQRARHVDAARRRRRDQGDQGGLRRPRLRARGLVDEVDDGPLLRGGRRGRGDDVRARAPRGRHPADDQLREPRSRSATSTTSRTRRARCRSTSRSRTRWASAATTAASCSAASTRCHASLALTASRALTIDGLGRELAERAEHDVRRGERLRRPAGSAGFGIAITRMPAARAARMPFVRVLDRRAARRLDAEPPRRLEVDVRRRLAAADLLRRDRRARRAAASPASSSTRSISGRFDERRDPSGQRAASRSTASTAPSISGSRSR